MAVRSSAESDASISSEKAWAAGAAPLLPFLEPPGSAGIFFFFPALPPPPEEDVAIRCFAFSPPPVFTPLVKVCSDRLTQAHHVTVSPKLTM